MSIVHCPAPATTSQYSIYMHLHPAYDTLKIKIFWIFLKTKQDVQVHTTFIYTSLEFDSTSLEFFNFDRDRDDREHTKPFPNSKFSFLKDVGCLQ